jgi:hypothetical protein
MEQETRRLLDELTGAINQALLSSNRFAQILDMLELAGHDGLVSVDATIDGGAGPDWIEDQPVAQRAPAQLNLSTRDRNFLHEMRIEMRGYD